MSDLTPAQVISSMCSDRAIGNYIVPGVSSRLVTGGLVRVFESSRQYAGEVTPHSHRFDFSCFVLSGHVINRVFERTRNKPVADFFTVRRMDYLGEVGGYAPALENDHVELFSYDDTTYHEGDWYTMRHSEFHSIYFSRGARVLFMEGPQVRKFNDVLLPNVDGQTLETMNCEADWMFSEQQQ